MKKLNQILIVLVFALFAVGCSDGEDKVRPKSPTINMLKAPKAAQKAVDLHDATNKAKEDMILDTYE
ncbi:MAG: hypothetical protein KAT46_07205 [Deltaproteobacteria bacterium]|nr:hypothetical protein [Deltaproteobacteria bacterium]